MHPDDVIRIDSSQFRRDHGASIVADCAVAGVAKTVHEGFPGPGNASVVPARFMGRTGEPVAGQRWDNQMESVSRVAPECAGITQWLDDIKEFHNRSRPAMGHD